MGLLCAAGKLCGSVTRVNTVREKRPNHTGNDEGVTPAG